MILNNTSICFPVPPFRCEGFAPLSVLQRVHLCDSVHCPDACLWKVSLSYTYTRPHCDWEPFTYKNGSHPQCGWEKLIKLKHFHKLCVKSLASSQRNILIWISEVFYILQFNSFQELWAGCVLQCILPSGGAASVHFFHRILGGKLTHMDRLSYQRWNKK